MLKVPLFIQQCKIARENKLKMVIMMQQWQLTIKHQTIVTGIQLLEKIGNLGSKTGFNKNQEPSQIVSSYRSNHSTF